MQIASDLQAAGTVRISLVDPKSDFHHMLGATRALARQGFENLIHIAPDRALKEVTRVVGIVSRVDAATRQLFYSPPDGGETSLQYDFLVVATGMAWRTPGYSPLASSAASKQAYRDVRSAITASTGIVIVGGGSVGAEVAGEVASGYPGKKVTLVHSGGHLINGADNGAAASEPAIGAAALSRLEAMGVRVLLNDRVPKPVTDEEAAVKQVAPHVWAGTTSLRTDKGQTLDCDLQLWTTGGGGANTGFLRDSGLSESLVPVTGEVKVDAHFRVPGHPRIFAAGDCAASGHPKMAIVIERATASVVAANVLAVAKAAAAGKGEGDAAGLKSAIAWSHTAIIVVLSPRVGFGKLGPLWLPDAIVSAVKGGDKLVGRYLKKFGYTQAELEAAAAAAAGGETEGMPKASATGCCAPALAAPSS